MTTNPTLNPEPPKFSNRKMRLRRFETLPEQSKEEALRSVNTIRAEYPWSKRTIKLSETKDLYLVCTSQACFGFIECTVNDLDLAYPKRATMYLHELHVAPSAREQGVASAVLGHLLGKGLPIEMVVANANEKMLKLVAKFGAVHSSITEHTRSITLPGRAA